MFGNMGGMMGPKITPEKPWEEKTAYEKFETSFNSFVSNVKTFAPLAAFGLIMYQAIWQESGLNKELKLQAYGDDSDSAIRWFKLRALFPFPPLSMK
mmetsp:Transcript_6735/g.9783  ORF Transcript_6735/g.9783 Transcript_6735/m.9783 type:complete len:97 (-) Transcript_6735:47-337(-)